eukprot:3610923-Rhodomonas_salina.2
MLPEVTRHLSVRTFLSAPLLHAFPVVPCDTVVCGCGIQCAQQFLCDEHQTVGGGEELTMGCPFLQRYLGNSLRICIHPNDSSDGVIKLQMIEVLRAHWKEGFAEGKGGGLNGCRNCLKVQSCFSLVRFGVQRRFADKQLSTVLSGPQWRTNFVQHPAQAFHTSRLGEQRCCLENPASHDV